MSPLESSVTLEDVFAVVDAKRVPLAPELAGYLSLEIADGTDAGGGDVDPRSVFISEDGTVALVRAKRDAVTGEAESSIRNILARLLDASGSATPALSAAARRKAGNGLPALVEELEAALIPVNRAAGRRALARLAREVKRVMLGIGRNASVPPILGSRPATKPSPDDLLGVPGDVALRSRTGRVFDDEATTVPRRSNPLSDAPPLRGGPLPPPPGRPPSAPPGPPPRRDAGGGLGAEGRPERRGEKLFDGTDVESLLQGFEVSSAHGDKQMARELKAMAGLSPTPPPPDDATLESLTKDVGKDLPKTSAEGDSVEALLALADASGPLAPPLPPPGFSGKPDAPRSAAANAAEGGAPSAPPPRPDPSFPAPIVAPPSFGAPAPPAMHPAAPPAMHPPAPPAMHPPAPPAMHPPPPMPPAPAVPTAAADTGHRARVEATTTGSRRRRNTGSRREPRAPKTTLLLLVLLLLVLFGGVAFIWYRFPAFFTGRKRPAAQPAASSAAAVAPPAPKCKVALVVTDAPANAEILLRMGQAPLDVERMPVGTRLELVGTAEGYAPKRAVIKAESTWDKGPDGKPRLDVPVQLDPSKAKPGALDPWPGAEPGSQVGGSGAPGTVHVVSNVRGAEIWLLAGLGPEARIEQLRCDGDIDVLLAGPPTLRNRLHVSEQEIEAAPADDQGNKVVSVSAK